MADDGRIVEAILGALRFRDGQHKPLSSLSVSEWEELLHYGDLSHVTLPLLGCCAAYLPDWARRRVEQNLSDNSVRVKLIRSSYLEIQTAFASKAIEHIVLKGFAQYPDYCPDLRLRFQSDIDLYCPEEVLPRALDALRDLGYAPIPTASTADHLPAMIRKGDWEWRGNMYDPEMPPSVELHHRMWNHRAMRFGPTGLEKSFWSRRTTRVAEDFTFPSFCPIDQLGFSAVQVLRDLLSFGLLAHKVYELAYFLHSNADNDAFWNQWRRAHDDDLRSCEAVAFLLAEACFGCNISPQVADEIDTLPTSVLNWVARYGNTSLNTHRALNKDAVWLHIALVESLRDRFATFRKVIPKAPDLQKALAGSSGSARTSGRWKNFTRYALYCLVRLPLHALLIPRIVYGGLNTFFVPVPLGRISRNRTPNSVVDVRAKI